MKKTFLILAICLGITVQDFAQNDYRDPSDNPVRDFSLFATVGSRPFQLSGTDLYFRYVDESPSQDNMASEIQLRQTNHSYGAKLGFQNMSVRGVTIKAMVDLFGGQVAGATIDVGAGYTIGRKKFHIRPMGILSYGGYGISLGSLEQNGEYIQVNSTKFYGEKVYVDLKTRQFIMSPQIEFGYEITEKFELLLSGGYNFGISAKPFLKFSGYDLEDEWVKETEKLGIPNATLSYGGARLTKSPVGINGAFIHAGLGFRFPQ